MHKRPITIFIFLILSLIPMTAHSGMYEVIRALEEVKQAINFGLSESDFDSLQEQLDMQINIVKEDEFFNEIFIQNAIMASTMYEIAFKYSRIGMSGKAREAITDGDRFRDVCFSELTRKQ